MGTGYTRNDTSNNIADGNIINASDLDGEFDAIESAFNGSTGHSHDGSTGEGPIINVFGDSTDSISISSAALIPNADDTIDLGSSGAQFKDLHLDGTANIDSLVADTADINGGTIDGTVIGGTTPAAGTFTTGQFNTSLNVDGTVTADGLTVDTNTLHVDSTNNRVGIGTSSPDTKLTISDSGTSPSFRLFNGGNTADITSYTAQAGLQFISYQSDSGSPYTKTSAIIANGDGTVPSELQFWTKTNGQSSPAERVRIDSSGNVGINRTSPDGLLHMQSPSGTDSALYIQTSAGTDDSVIHFGDDSASSVGSILYNHSTDAMQFETLNSERMRIDSSGNVGINQSALGGGAKLEVNGDIGIARTAGGYTFRETYGGGERAGINSNASNELLFNIGAASEAMRIDSAGRLGIGCNSPAIQGVDNADDLVIGQGDGNHGITISSFNTSNGTLAFIDTTNATVGRGFVDYDHNVDAMSFGTLSTERLRITSAGRIGIGESNPDGLVHLTGDTNSNGAELFLQVNNNNTTDNLGAIHFGNNVDSTLSRILGGTSGANNSSYLTFSTSNAGSQAERVRIDSSGNVGIGTSSPSCELTVSSGASSAAVHTYTQLEIESASHSALQFSGSTGAEQWIWFADDASSPPVGGITYYHGGPYMGFRVEGSEAMRIDSSGNVQVGKTSGSFTDAGIRLLSNGQVEATVNGNDVVNINRLSSDGSLVRFFQDTVLEGSISVSGSTVSYNGGHLARWSQLTDGTKDEAIVKGTVMTNLDQMAVWSHDASEAQDAYTEDNEQLNCMAVSSVEGDPNVAGVFVNWDNDDDQFNDMNIAMTGDMVIRIAQGTTVARGDLLMSAGDGTAKPQGDDIVRSKTIAKVTSTNVSHTYDDGSYCVPCVLMAC